MDKSNGRTKYINQTMMQFFEWYLPEDGLHWNRAKARAKELAESGINMVWLPPAYKGAAGDKSVGYDVYDTYDLGEFEQKGSVSTKYGTKEQYLKAIDTLQNAGIEVLADVVLNHMMGADDAEKVTVVEYQENDRTKVISGEKEICAWTKFTFPGRNGKYSSFQWNQQHFSGTDWDDASKRSGIFGFQGKTWNPRTDREKGNYDYLMGADLDMDCKETVDAVTNWGKWYLDTAKMDGFRLDAVKHINSDFYRQWLKDMRAHAGKDLFVVGEYWSDDTTRLLDYLAATEHSLSLFDVPLHFAFYKASTSDGNFDMGTLLSGALCSTRPQNAVTFVDNHDTQPGQALCSFVPAWFKCHAYAVILLQKNGIPCVFYGDYYGIPHDHIAPVFGLRTLCAVRLLFAYGEEKGYYDDANIVGFTRTGDEEHADSGVAVLLTDTVGGSKRMQVNRAYAGEAFYNILNPTMAPVVLDEEGCGWFYVEDGQAAVWIRKNAYDRLQGGRIVF